MKEIEDAVKELSLEKLRQIAEGYYEKLAYYQIKNTIQDINCYSKKPDKEVLLRIKKQDYLSQKKELSELDLWNTKYEKFYKQALKNKLYHQGLFAIED